VSEYDVMRDCCFPVMSLPYNSFVIEVFLLLHNVLHQHQEMCRLDTANMHHCHSMIEKAITSKSLVLQYYSSSDCSNADSYSKTLPLEQYVFNGSELVKKI
jgi:hypothetical protein